MIRGPKTSSAGVALAVGGWLWMVGIGSPAAAGLITEVLTGPQEGPGGESPAYVELFYEEAPAAFDFAVLNASPGRELQIERLVRVEPVGDESTLLIHEGTWPSGAGSEGQRIEVSEGGLGLVSGSVAAARRLVVFNGPAVWKDTGFPFTEGTNIPEADLWAEGLEVTDSVALSLNGAAVGTLGPDYAPLEEVETLSLDGGEAAYRWHDGERYAERFEAGALDADLRFVSGAEMDPGRRNNWWDEDGAAVPLPVPSAGLMTLGALVMLGLVSRPRRRG